MKKMAVFAALFLSGCVSIEFPGLVTDAVKATKDLYKEATSDKTEPAKAEPGATSPRHTLAHSYAGKDSQTVAEIKRSCVTEAARKLGQVAGKEMPYTVVENEIATVNGKVVANCKLAVEN
jgi:PBP1b-binding outer membrane lipoprotein LpoB